MYTPHRAKEALKELGGQIRLARKRRLWTIAEMAKKMDVSSPTVMSLEKGEPTVSVGIVFSALWMLGLEAELLQLTHPHDSEGIKMMNLRLPKKVRTRKGTMSNDF